jgi:hypothetical protein
VPLHPIRFTYVGRFFIAAHQFYLKPNHCFSVAGISRQGFL